MTERSLHIPPDAFATTHIENHLHAILENYSIVYPVDGNQPGLQWGVKHNGKLIGVFPSERLAQQYSFYYHHRHLGESEQ